jgi:hypothetical protein
VCGDELADFGDDELGSFAHRYILTSTC